jgi:hypothetical protein
MEKFTLVLLLCFLPVVAFAHEERILPIKPDGTVTGLPQRFGAVRVQISRSRLQPKSISGVAVTSSRFNIRLNSCVTDKLQGVVSVEASGSWYHDLKRMPPYLSLTFYTKPESTQPPEFYSVTISLVDGHILMGQRTWDPWWGSWRGKVIEPADKCSDWSGVGLWPNKSFKPNPLRGSA